MTGDSFSRQDRASANLTWRPDRENVPALVRIAQRVTRSIAPPVHQLICPRCRWKCSRRSKRRGSLDLLLALLQLHPFRCRSCGRRYYRLAL